MPNSFFRSRTIFLGTICRPSFVFAYINSKSVLSLIFGGRPGIFFISSPRIPSFLNACHQFLIVLYVLNNIFDTSVMVFPFFNRWYIASIFTFLFGLFYFLYASTTSSIVFVVTCYKSILAINVSFNLFFANLFWCRYRFHYANNGYVNCTILQRFGTGYTTSYHTTGKFRYMQEVKSNKMRTKGRQTGLKN